MSTDRTDWPFPHARQSYGADVSVAGAATATTCGQQQQRHCRANAAGLLGMCIGDDTKQPTDRLLRLPRSGCPSVHVPVPGGSRRRNTPQPILGGDGTPQFSLRRVSVPYPAVQAESDAAIRMASTRLVSLLGGETAVLQADGRLG